MRAVFFTAAAFSAILTAFAAPTFNNVPITKFAGPVKPNSYIIKLKDGVHKDSHITKLLSSTIGSTIGYSYDQVLGFPGYAAELKGLGLAFVRQSKDVESIFEDGIVTLDHEFSEDTGVTRPTMISRGELTGSTKGKGVDVYGIDTGIQTNHTDFGGRARWGATFGGYANEDGNGHGTHTAATAVGYKYGVATSASITAVKVLSDEGSGAISDIIAGVLYVAVSALASGRPSIATLSLGGSTSPLLDFALGIAIKSGVHCTVAAGNSNVDAAETSPARVEAANTVGAVDSDNKKAYFSNYGSLLDVWALGVAVKSAWIGTDTTETLVLSGTSMATPLVAGVLAMAIEQHGNKSPAELSEDLKTHARPVVTGQPDGTMNLLATLW
ncbi:unnamed protein product [Rhizoctonia solani]|uniref:Cuticle-degrading protease n=1 Tax=Rhizoctonia solani TaxID=456999 RepID=A0A8H3GJ61_9AGAM|nr:unnamed protein product [Rhizoctonia solani]